MIATSPPWIFTQTAVLLPFWCGQEKVCTNHCLICTFYWPSSFTSPTSCHCRPKLPNGVQNTDWVASDPKCFTCDITFNHFSCLIALLSHVKSLSCLHTVLPSVSCCQPCRAETQGTKASTQLPAQAFTNCHSGAQLAHPTMAHMTPLHALPSTLCAWEAPVPFQDRLWCPSPVCFPRCDFVKLVLLVCAGCCERQVYAVSCR